MMKIPIYGKTKTVQIHQSVMWLCTKAAFFPSKRKGVSMKEDQPGEGMNPRQTGYSGIAENIRKLLFSQGWSPHPNPTVTLRSFVRQHPVATCRRIAAVTLPWRFPATVLICLLNKSWKIELILDSINKMGNVGEHGNTFFCSELKLVHFSNNQTWEFMCHRSVKVTPVLGTYHGCKEMFLSIQLYDGKNCGKRKGFPPAMC